MAAPVVTRNGRDSTDIRRLDTCLAPARASSRKGTPGTPG
jgi:hypothetical protein